MREHRNGHVIFSTAKVDESGRIALPQAVREKYGYGTGNSIVLLGNDRGLAIMKADEMKQLLDTSDKGELDEDHYLLGRSEIDEKGQIILSEKAREKYGLASGDTVIILGDEKKKGPAMVKADLNNRIIAMLLDALKLGDQYGMDGKSLGQE